MKCVTAIPCLPKLLDLNASPCYLKVLYKTQRIALPSVHWSTVEMGPSFWLHTENECKFIYFFSLSHFLMIGSVSAVRASRQSILNKHSYSRSGSISDEDSEADSESELIPSETEFTHPFDYPHVASSSVSLALSNHSSLPSSPPPSSEASGTNSCLPSLEPDSSDGDIIYFVNSLNSDSTIEKPARKRQRRSHITSDRYIVQQGTDTDIQESFNLSTGRSQRVDSIELFYGRIKRKYSRKQCNRWS